MKRISISSLDPVRLSPWLAVVLKRSRLGEGGARRAVALREGGFFNFRALMGLLLCTVTACFILIPIRSGLAFLHAPSNALQRTLTFGQRVSYQRVIEEVYWRHRIWPKERPEPKPSLDAVMSQVQLEKSCRLPAQATGAGELAVKEG